MSTSLRQADGRRRNRLVPRVDHLETRDCPAAPVLTAFSATVLGGHSVQLTGTVQTDHPSGVTVNFSGVASGLAAVEADGSFALTTMASSLGTINAVASDFPYTSNLLSSEITSATPS